MDAQHVRKRCTSTFAFVSFWKISVRPCCQWDREGRKEENKDICLTSVSAIFTCFQPTGLKDTWIMLPDTQTTVQSRVDSSVATWEKIRSPLMLSWTAENTLAECQRETSQKTDGENMQFKECNLSRKLPYIDRNCLNLLKISIVTPRLLSSMPKMSNWLNLFIFKVPFWDVSSFFSSQSLRLDLISSGFGRLHLVVLFIYTWMKRIWGPLWQTCFVILQLFKEA